MRLNQKNREVLMQFARETVTSPETAEKADAAYEAAAKAVRAHIDQRYPPKDMKVLARYQVASQDFFINAGSWLKEETFSFRVTDPRAPVLPKMSSCNRPHLQWSAEERKLLEQYHLTNNIHKDALKTKLGHYNNLIIGAQTFEDIIAVWPGAAKLRRQMDPKKPPSLLPVSQASIDFIKADNAGATA